MTASWWLELIRVNCGVWADIALIIKIMNAKVQIFFIENAIIVIYYIEKKKCENTLFLESKLFA